MKSVKPITDKRKADAFFRSLVSKNPKYGVMFLIGVDTGLRISDILRLRVKDIKTRKKTFTVKEKKTKKRRAVTLSDVTIDYIKAFVSLYRLSQNDFLVYSRPQNKQKAISRTQAYRVMSSISSKNGLNFIGTHSMRKTYANNYISNGGSVEGLQNDFKHKDIKTTMSYLINPKRRKSKVQTT